MRLLSVRLLNLNSLRGVHEVRFDAPPLTGCGVFLIAGPTGAGKSSLLDALTLALYGRAARYGRTSPEEMMSRHTGECSAEVGFEAGGAAYLATWRMRRAKGSPSGKLQPVERRLVSMADGRAVAEKAGEVDTQIERLTGLDYDRFLRSVLLAQGEFAAFLKARPAERAELLEKITGTEIYSTLSQLTHSEYAAREQRVGLLRAQLAARTVLNEDARALEEAALREAQASVAECADRTRAARTDSDVIEKRWAAQQEAVAAAAAAAEFGRLAEERGRELAVHRQSLTTAAEKAGAAAAARVAREPLWRDVVELDTTIAQQKLAVANATEAVLKARTAAATARDVEARTRLAVDQEGLSAQATRQWLRDHEADLALEESLPALRGIAEEWRDAAQASALAQKAAAEAARWREAGGRAAAKAAGLEGELRAARSRHQAAVDLFGALTSQRDAQRQVVEHALQVQSLDQHRAQLVAGEPCPLCGATEHPRTGLTAGQVAAQADHARHLLGIREQELTTHQKELTAMVATLSQLETRIGAEREIERSALAQTSALAAPDAASLAALCEREAQCGERARSEFAVWRAPTDRYDDTTAVLTSLHQRAAAVSAAQKRDTDAEQSIARATATLAAAQSERERAESILHLAEAAVTTSENLVRDSLERRRSIFGDATVEGDRSTFEQAASEAHRLLEEGRSLEAQLATQQAEARARQEEALRREDELDQHRAGCPEVSGETRAEARQAVLSLEESLNARIEEVGRRQQVLEIDDRTRASIGDASRELGVAEAGLVRWERLHALIGSADGSRFSRFAQALTLRQLIGRANHHLARLAPRYRLVAAQEGDLNLRIVDLFQANTERPMESLSGGESFLASLALALGLSELASRHRSIDSLFIDEGFGSLDAGSLEVALAALENLQARGKTIGLISHVDLVRERIGTRIEVAVGPEGSRTLRVGV